MLTNWIANTIAKAPAGFTRQIVRIAQLAVALSICVMLLSTSLINGFQRQVSSKMFDFWGHIHITDATITRVLDEMPIQLPQQFYPLPKNWQQRISYTQPLTVFDREISGYQVRKTTKGGIKHIQSFATAAGIIQTKSEIEGIVLKGLGTNFDTTLLSPFIEEGRLVRSRQDSTERRDIVISRQTALRMDLQLNSNFSVYFVRDNQQIKRGFKVCGIYKTGLEEYDRKFALVDIAEIQSLRGWTSEQVGGFEVFLDDLNDMDVWANHMQESPFVPNTCYVQTVREKYPAIFEWLQLQDLNEWVILALMTVVALINMTTALLILILERTQMIGIFKALGSRNWLLQRIFLHYAARIVLVGLFFGNVVGLGLAWIQQQFGIIRLSEADYYLSVAPIYFDWAVIATINVATFFITITFLILPSLFVAQLSPLKALKFN